MQLDGVNQTSVNRKAGFTFSHALRTMLRQDPDVIMIGEIRDQETAEMAIRAALTGHLVFATLHTNSAAEAITRLCHMGIAPFHLISALTLIIAQRLVRKLCTFCQHGCRHCTDGFIGRTGIFELMPIDESIKTLILNQASHMTLRKHNQTNGQEDLWESALHAVKKGITSMNEIYRVIPNHA
jgi:type II secretory ATPase GspE/PulE/Tfp pilus assembly ATPase PilB-like protein